MCLLEGKFVSMSVCVGACVCVAFPLAFLSSCQRAF